MSDTVLTPAAIKTNAYALNQHYLHADDGDPIAEGEPVLDIAVTRDAADPRRVRIVTTPGITTSGGFIAAMDEPQVKRVTQRDGRAKLADIARYAQRTEIANSLVNYRIREF